MSKVLVNFIQDRSGSMNSVWEETLSGFKKFVQDLQLGAKEDNIDYLFSLTTFDTEINTPIVAMPVAAVNLETLGKYGPRGMTALYDAVGMTIQNTEADSHGADKIICVIVTDGHENSSREWDKDRLHAAIEGKLTLGNWTFTYLGTQPETWNDASAIGVGVGAVASYTPTRASAAYAVSANAVRSLSRSTARGSRALFSDHVSHSVSAAAGMKRRDHVVTPPTIRKTTSPTPKPISQPTRRWK